MALGAVVVAACGSSPTIDPTAAVSPTPDVASASDTPAAPASPSGDPVASSYEAVFLRLEVVDGMPEVLVVGVHPHGDERQIARLPGTWVAHALPSEDGYLAPMGAVSGNGLLALATTEDPDREPPLMRWEIFDLRRPDAPPIPVQGVEQGLEELATTPYLTLDMRPSVHWAAGERLGIPGHTCDELSCGVWSFFDGRTGAAIAGRPHAEPGCRSQDGAGAEITVFDGGVVRRGPDGGREELVPPGGATFACFAPDDSMIVHDFGVGGGPVTSTASQPISGLIDMADGTEHHIDGNFAGWLGAP
jgi:hypothetical protein